VTAALCLAALLLYLPANVLPIMRMTLYGATTENTVWQGCVRLYRSGDVPVAAVVFLASMLVPLLKLLGLMMLVATTGLRSGRWRRLRSRVFRGIETIGRWAMLDVFVLAVLVSLMKLRALATVVPARGALPFTAVVVLTVLASASFEPQLIWSRRRSAERRAGPRASGLTPNLQRTPARPPEGTNA
jgi:paraquat-inducible protein A